MNQHRTNLSILTISIASLLLNGCTKTIDGEGEVIQQSRTLQSFTTLTLEIPANITLVISDSVTCVISAQSNIADIITTKVDGEELKLESKNNYRATKPVEIVLSTPALEKITVNGSGDIRVLNSIKGSSLKLNINGSGDIALITDVNELRSIINGSGDLNLVGHAGIHRLQVNGSGNVHAFKLSVEKYRINLNGSGDAEVTATNTFDAKIIGSGNILYKGTPTVKTEITGSGDIMKSKD